MKEIFYKNQIIILLLFGLIFVFSSFAQNNQRKLDLELVKTLPGSAKRFALIIGVDNYSDTQITTLGGAANDAKALSDALVHYAGFEEENITLLTSTQPAERQPTRGNILRRLSNLAALIPKDGMLIFAFAGHGIERNGQAFLLPSDAQVNDDIDLLELTAINVLQVKEKIIKIGVGQVLVFLDACRNDPVGRSDTDNRLSKSYTQGFGFDVANREVQAFATIYATAVGQRAYEYKERKQGYFTWALVEGLKGGAANPRGEITLAGLVKYLQEKVPKKVLLDLGVGKVQYPYAEIAGFKADELIISVNTNTKNSPPIKSNDKDSSNESQPIIKNRPESLPDKQNTAVNPSEITPIENSDDLGIAGTWTGTRGLESSLVFLIVSGSKGNTFTGVLKLKGFHIAVQGELNPKTRQMSMQEVKVLQTGDEQKWTLSRYKGVISRDKKNISGMLDDGIGNIAWSFTKAE